MLKSLNYNAHFMQLVGEINSDMPRYSVEKALRQAQDNALRPGCGWERARLKS